ncbi:MAG: hypothetical protein P4L40_23110 [Terracidiphilus sp.]|nr:hypothetical protein [Terracidiphilus sp.]
MGFCKFLMCLSVCVCVCVRPEKYMGELSVWDSAEQALEQGTFVCVCACVFVRCAPYYVDFSVFLCMGVYVCPCAFISSVLLIERLLAFFSACSVCVCVCLLLAQLW